ncbi:MAG TPA: hypothetical protein VIL86_13500 [Tepidisphaeraceae bacterium]|jgi:hypothetical protein
MALPKLKVKNGQFTDGKQRVVPFGPVYFARKPGTCGAPYFDEQYWPEAKAWMEKDFPRMAELGCNFVVPFVKTTSFYQQGKPVEKYFRRFDYLLKVAEANGLYVLGFPNCPPTNFKQVMGRPYQGDVEVPVLRSPLDEQVQDWFIRMTTIWGERYGDNGTLLGLLAGAGGGRLWTGYAGYAPNQPEGKEMLPFKPHWQAWLRRKYQDDFDAFVKSHPRLPENPRRWEDVALPVEVEGQFTEDDSRTFDFLAFQAHLSALDQNEVNRRVKKTAPNILLSGGAEGCEFERGPMECLVPGINNVDFLWVEAFNFTMVHGGHTHPDFERKHFHEPVGIKKSIDMLSVCTEAWERARYLKAASLNTAMILDHGTVLDSLVRWTPTAHDQRVLFERLHRTYLEAGADGLGFWCWTDDETSSRPEPEFFYREGETMGMIDFHANWRPVARRAAVYARSKPIAPRVSTDVLLLLPTPHMMGLDRIDGLTTVACLTSALARLGIAPEVKATYFRGEEGIPLEQLTPHKLVVVGADEYRKDFPSVPPVLRKYVEGGGHLVMALGKPDAMLSATLQEYASRDLAALTGNPKLLATNHQHNNQWWKSVRWRLREDFLEHWDVRMGRWMPGKAEKRLHYKFLELPKKAKLLAEAAVPHPSANEKAFGSETFASAGESHYWPLYYKHPLGKGWVYVLAYSFNVFRGWVDEIDVQREDWDWILQAAVEDADVQTDPCHSLSVLAQEFLVFRPTT